MDIDFDPLYKMQYNLIVSVQLIEKAQSEEVYIVFVRLEGYEKGWYSNFTVAVIGSGDFYTMDYGTIPNNVIYKNSVYKTKLILFKDPFDNNGVMYVQVGMVGRQKWRSKYSSNMKKRTKD